MTFRVTKKTGFKAITKDIIIFCNGLPFYVKRNFLNRDFNLPKGKYELKKGDIVKLKRPLIYTLPKLAKRYNFVKSPKGFKVEFSHNPNKCTVDLNKKNIVFDKSFLNEPTFVLDFVQFHELGHFRYSGKGLKSEIDCDNFAIYCMLVRGYNPSQIRYASRFTLGNSKASRIRKKENYKQTKNIKSF